MLINQHCLLYCEQLACICVLTIHTTCNTHVQELNVEFPVLEEPCKIASSCAGNSRGQQTATSSVVFEMLTAERPSHQIFL